MARKSRGCRPSSAGPAAVASWCCRRCSNAARSETSPRRCRARCAALQSSPRAARRRDNRSRAPLSPSVSCAKVVSRRRSAIETSCGSTIWPRTWMTSAPATGAPSRESPRSSPSRLPCWASLTLGGPATGANTTWRPRRDAWAPGVACDQVRFRRYRFERLVHQGRIEPHHVGRFIDRRAGPPEHGTSAG